jgi:predicted SAM-dependent methyltransferase
MGSEAARGAAALRADLKPAARRGRDGGTSPPPAADRPAILTVPVGARIARAFDRRVQMVRHRGDDVICPLCGHAFAQFKPDHDRANALCWRCGSHERHRAQWLLFERRPALLSEARALLHFAPEWALRRRLQQVDHLRYVTADLAQPGVELHLDITAMLLDEASFDAVICSHVLEHVEDDAAAMRELRRITAPGGWCLIMVPLDHTRSATYEDPALTGPMERERAFWQHDHVRLYAPDIGDRLCAAGFDVEWIRPLEEFGAAALERHRLLEVDHLLLCRPALPC